jgi:uncharacterized membrane protein
MSQELIGILFALVSVTSYAVASILTKVATKNYTPQKLLFTRNVTTALIILMVAVAKGDMEFLRNTIPIVAVFGISLFVYFGVMAITKAYALGKLGVTSAIAEARFIPSMVVYALVFGQAIRGQQYIAAFLVTVAITMLLIVSNKRSDAKDENRAIKLSVLNALIFGIGFALMYFPTMAIGSLPTGFLSEFFLMLIAMVHLFGTKELFKKDVLSGLRKNIPVAIAAALGTIFFYTALSIGNPSSVAITMASAPVLNIIGGRLVFGEKYTKLEWVSVGVVLMALLILAL